MSLDHDLHQLAAACRRAPDAPDPWRRLAEAAARHGAWDLLEAARAEAPPSPEAEAALRAALAAAGLVGGTPGARLTGSRQAALGPDGASLVRRRGADLELLGPPGFRVLARLPLPPGAPVGLALGPEGPRLLTRRFEGGVAHLEGYEGGPAGLVRRFGVEGRGRGAWLSPAGDVVVFGGAAGLWACPWGGADPVALPVEPTWDRVEQVAFSADGAVVAVRTFGRGGRPGYEVLVHAFATRDGARLVDPVEAPEGIVSGDGRWLVAWVLDSTRIRHQLEWRELGGSRRVRVDPGRGDRPALAACGEGPGVLARWRVGQEVCQWLPGPDAAPEPLEPAPGWRGVLPGSRPGAWLVQTEDDAVQLFEGARPVFGRDRAGARYQDFDVADDGRVMTRESGGVVRTWDPVSGQELKARLAWDHPAPLALTDRLVLRWAADGLSVSERARGRRLAGGMGLDIPQSYRLLDVDAAGRELLLAGSREVMRYDVQAETVRWRASPPGRRVALARLAPDQATAWVYLSSNASLVVLDAATGDALRAYPLREHGLGPKAAAVHLAWEGPVGYLCVDGAAFRLEPGGGVAVLSAPGETAARAAVDPGTGRVAQVDGGGVVRLGARVLGELGAPALALRFTGGGAGLVALLPKYLRVFSDLPRPGSS